MLQRKKETANIWKYKIGNNVNIANCVCVCENSDLFARITSIYNIGSYKGPISSSEKHVEGT